MEDIQITFDNKTAPKMQKKNKKLSEIKKRTFKPWKLSGNTKQRNRNRYFVGAKNG